MEKKEHKEKFERPLQDIITSYKMDCYFHSKLFGNSKYFKRLPHRPFCQRCGEHCFIDSVRMIGLCYRCYVLQLKNN